MIVALFALSAAMVIGGVVAVIQGFPFVRLESGLSMVIAGATVASAGAVVSGLAVVAMGLRRVAHAFDARRIVDAVSTMQDGIRLPPAAPSTSPVPVPVEPGPVRPTLPSVLVPAAAAGLLGGQSRTDPVFADSYAEPAIPEPVPAEAPAEPSSDPAADSAAHSAALLPEETPAEALQHSAEPSPEHLHDRPAESEHLPEHPAAAPMPAAAHPEPELPLPGLTPPEPAAASAPAPSPQAPAPEDDLFAPSEPLVLRPSLDAEPAVPEPTLPEPSAPEVVGRYASGGNTYVMYADGAIEAETPQGRFNFASLDELKAFVEAGGEAGSRGAA